MWADENKTLEQSNNLSSYKKSDCADKKSVHYICLHAFKHVAFTEFKHRFCIKQIHIKNTESWFVVGIISQQQTLPVSVETESQIFQGSPDFSYLILPFLLIHSGVLPEIHSHRANPDPYQKDSESQKIKKKIF